jgi:transcriptional regulator with XRE-family HTH domain
MNQIRELRNLKGVSQARLAVTAGMDPATLNRIEQGKGNPNLKTLEKLAQALGVGVTDLLEEEAPKVQSPQPRSQAAALPEEEQRGLTVLYRELARKGRAVEQSLKSGEQPDFEEMKELDFAHALLAKKRGKRDIRGKDLDELAEAEDELFLVKASISRLLEQELFEDLDEKQRAEAEAFKRRQARTFRTEEQVTERDTA